MNKENFCKHIAIIMDGNGRWAKKRAMPRTFGHKEGAKNVVELVKSMKESGIEYLTLYAFSTENWNRSKDEVSALMNLLSQYLDNELKEIMQNNVKVMFIGERYMLDKNILEKMEYIENESKNNSNLTLCIALSYGSRHEIINAVKETAKMVINKEIDIEDLTQELFAKNLYTNSIPDPDILIRTSGEQRISNYLLWQLAYTELFFTDTYWPDFKKDELLNIIEQFNRRERRYGKN